MKGKFIRQFTEKTEKQIISRIRTWWPKRKTLIYFPGKLLSFKWFPYNRRKEGTGRRNPLFPDRDLIRNDSIGFLSAAQPTDQGEESVVLLVVVVVVVGGTIFQSPMYSFLGCEKAKTLSTKDVTRQKLCLNRGVTRQKLCLKRGVTRQKLCLKRGVTRQKLCLKGVGQGKKFI